MIIYWQFSLQNYIISDRKIKRYCKTKEWLFRDFTEDSIINVFFKKNKFILKTFLWFMKGWKMNGVATHDMKDTKNR